MDELFESLTLIQTGKVQNFPVVLFGSAYWSGLYDWLRTTWHYATSSLPLAIIQNTRA